ncbi:tRNA:m(4)X modification enzyme TRM13 homolog isoform X2 [Galleria mellonella]|nr:tRNA:m(4)X modification enzyme TRM13 homolog isoform X2 [Galleria mellonella]
MTVRPGRQYCGEHEPKPTTEDGSVDNRIPCPNDPKHTCYASKLEKHLKICNARQVEQPPYIIPNINAPLEGDAGPRKPLAEVSREDLMQLIDKVNLLYEKYVQDNIATFPEHPIHAAVQADFNESNRTESSRRHLRQVSSLLWIVEEEGLAGDQTCYVELGAGKGRLSEYVAAAWRGARVLLVDRAALRHKRDGRLAARLAARPAAAAAAAAARRLRADLAHVALRHAPLAAHATRLVALAKHLCGAATDYALRCVVNEDEECEREAGGAGAGAGGAGGGGGGGDGGRRRGLVVAACCHHRAHRASYVARAHLAELGVNDADLDIMLGIVSWATCGDGRSRDSRGGRRDDAHSNTNTQDSIEVKEQKLSQEWRERVGRRTKALLDWGRVLYLEEKGFDARLCYYVPTSVSLENMCIIAKKVR